jgi:murein L,D-transpeptidase YcbB/YkuD
LNDVDQVVLPCGVAASRYSPVFDVVVVAAVKRVVMRSGVSGDSIVVSLTKQFLAIEKERSWLAEWGQ